MANIRPEVRQRKVVSVVESRYFPCVTRLAEFFHCGGRPDHNIPIPAIKLEEAQEAGASSAAHHRGSSGIIGTRSSEKTRAVLSLNSNDKSIVDQLHKPKQNGESAIPLAVRIPILRPAAYAPGEIQFEPSEPETTPDLPAVAQYQEIVFVAANASWGIFELPIEIITFLQPGVKTTPVSKTCKQFGEVYLAAEFDRL